MGTVHLPSFGLKCGRLTEGVRVRGSTKFGSCRPMRLPMGGRQNGGPDQPGSLAEGTHTRDLGGCMYRGVHGT